MSEELKRCPFCGGEATLCDDGKEWFYIVCGDCGVATDHVSAEEIAVRIWNTRPEEDRLKAENERSFERFMIIANQRNFYHGKSSSFEMFLEVISRADYGKKTESLSKSEIIKYLRSLQNDARELLRRANGESEK